MRSSVPQIVTGQVMHRRLRPVLNAFVYPVFYVRLPLRRLEACRRTIFSIDRPNVLSFYRADHGARDGSALLPWIEAQLRTNGLPADGEIVLQTFPRVFGMVFNPVSFWFCHDRAGALVAVLAEVNNTFGASHSYLLHNADATPLRDGQELRAAKRLHVSPFNTVVGGYCFRFHLRSRGGQAQTAAYIDYYDAADATATAPSTAPGAAVASAEPLLRTAINGTGQGWSTRALLAAVARMPWLALAIVLRIHWQALRLWWRGVHFHGVHPPHLLKESNE